MLYIVRKVDTRCAVLDNEDGVLEWFLRDDLEKHIADGLDIRDMTESDGEGISISWDLCNWVDGDNIFSDAAYLFMEHPREDGKFAILCRDRKDNRKKPMKVIGVVEGFNSDSVLIHITIPFAFSTELPINVWEGLKAKMHTDEAE